MRKRYLVCVLTLTCARNGVIIAPIRANAEEVPRPEARIDVGYTCQKHNLGLSMTFKMTLKLDNVSQEDCVFYRYIVKKMFIHSFHTLKMFTRSIVVLIYNQIIFFVLVLNRFKGEDTNENYDKFNMNSITPGFFELIKRRI